jgi:hypothetical protein
MEVIRDFIAELAPMGWQCGFEEPIDGEDELGLGGVISVMGDVGVHHPPLYVVRTFETLGACF